MAKISVQLVSAEKYEVTVEAGTTTTHEVTLSRSYLERVSGGKAVTAEHMIETSFRFLLARESNTMILERFDLPVIGRYFPEFEGVIKGMLVNR